MTDRPGRRGQRGVVLVVALIALLVLGTIAATVARTGRLEQRMALNDEARIAALQHALGAVDAVLASRDNIPLASAVDYRLCSPGAAQPACNAYSLTLPPEVVPAEGHLAVGVTRLAPLQGRLPVATEAAASSTVYYRVAKFEVWAGYDATAAGLGRKVLAQGLLVRLPTSPQGGVSAP